MEMRKPYKSGVTVLQKRNIYEGLVGTKAKTVAFTALMSALVVVMSFPPLAIPLSVGAFTTSFHFFQLPIFICAILAGPWAGLLSGAVGGLYMGITRIPFIIGGIALLGACTGLLAKRFRPILACLFGWSIQVPYVIITDYVWFTNPFFMGISTNAAWGLILPIIVNLGLQAAICAVLADIIVHFTRKAGVAF